MRHTPATSRPQSTGSTFTENAAVLDREHTLPVVLYRLVDPVDGASGGPWGEGLLVKLARDEQYVSDNALRAAIVALLEQPWAEDPLRNMMFLSQAKAGRGRAKGGFKSTSTSCPTLPAAEVEEAAASATDAPSAAELPAPEHGSCKSGADPSSGSFRKKSVEVASPSGSFRKKSVELASGRKASVDDRMASLRKGGRIGALTALMSRSTKVKHDLEAPAHKMVSTNDATWGHVIVHARGNVGETALHLCFLLNTEA